MTVRGIRALPAARATSAVLFASLFAAQAGVIAVTPVLAELGRDLDVSTADRKSTRLNSSHRL